MRPVNLLPDQYRPARTAEGRGGSAYVVIGVLLVALVGMLVYVLTANGITSKKEQTADAKREAKAAQAGATTLTPFQQFTAIKTTRTASVTQLAQARFDWERLIRELAHVLPSGTWLTEVNASTTTPDESAQGAQSTSVGAPVPTATLSGCASDQPDVAKLMVRLRKLHRVKDVQLAESSQGSGGSSGSSSAPAASGSSGGFSQGCADLYEFDVEVTFEGSSSQEPGTRRVPASLGGGA